MTCILVNCLYELFTLHEQCASKIKLDDIENVIPVKGIAKISRYTGI